MSTIEKMDKLAKESQQIVQQVIQIWNTEVFLSWRWWFGVIITILTWLFWIKFHKKESRCRLLAAGFFVTTISLVLDSIGVQLGLWTYRYEVIPLIPAFIPYDLALMPVAVMSLIQYKPNFSPFIKSVIFAVGASFIGEPLIVFTDIYQPVRWRFSYSVPFYLIIYLIASSLATNQKYKNLI